MEALVPSDVQSLEIGGLIGQLGLADPRDGTFGHLLGDLDLHRRENGLPGLRFPASVAAFALTMLQEEAFKEGTLHSGRPLYAPSHCRALLTIVWADTTK